MGNCFLYFWFGLYFLKSAIGYSGYGPIRLYDERFYQGLFTFMELHVGSEDCINLNNYERDTLSSIQVFGSCVVLFTEIRCTGRSLRVTHSIPLLSAFKFEDVTKSYRACSQKEAVMSNRLPQFSLFDLNTHRNVLLNYYDACGCVNLPKRFMKNRVSSVYTYGNCLEMWKSPNCQGDRMELRDPELGKRGVLTNGFDNATQSIRVCPDTEAHMNCVTFHGVVKAIRFSINENLRKMLQGEPTSKIELGPPGTLINTGDSPVYRQYKASRTVEEIYVFERIRLLQKLHSVVVDENQVVVDVKGGDSSSDKPLNGSDINAEDENVFSSWISGIGKQLFGQYDADLAFLREEKFKENFQYAFPFQAKDGSGYNGQWVGKSARTFKIDQTVKVPDQNTYIIRSFVEMIDNYKIPYVLEIKIHGWDNGRQMTSDEIVGKLEARGFKTIFKSGPFFATVMVSGRLRATFGVRASAEVNSQKMGALGFLSAGFDAFKDFASLATDKLFKAGNDFKNNKTNETNETDASESEARRGTASLKKVTDLYYLV